MITFDPAASIDAAAVAGLSPRAVVAGIDRLDLVPRGVAGYAVLGDAEADRLAGRLPAAIAGARALIANRSEAARLTGEATPDGAALVLAESVETAVVTCGAEGAVAASGGELVTVPAPSVRARDTTGAGDLLTAGYVWGDLEGRPLAERLRRAVVYAALSVRTATGAASAATLEELERALSSLAGEVVQQSSAKEDT
jgi:sugar/nucleoside kinase (ribokinase family)